MRLASIDVGVKNLAFAVLDVSGAEIGVRAWHSVSAVAPATCVRGMCKVDAAEAVMRALEEHADELLECDTVLVEAQPRFSPLNVQTSHAIVAYFVLRKRVDLAERVAVHLVHAGKKNAWTRSAAAPAPGATRGARYLRNKAEAAAACAEVVERGRCARLAAVWGAFKKKDDAADALVMALAWLGRPRATARVVAADVLGA
jgi:hypothetical protein